MIRNEVTLAAEDHREAFTEVSFLLHVLNDTIGRVTGGSKASVGVAAGRFAAKKLPVDVDGGELKRVLEILEGSLEDGFALSFEVDEKGAWATVERCAVRDVCENRGLELGGDLCVMLHHYVAGMAAELLGKPARASKAEAGSTCRFRLDVRK